MFKDHPQIVDLKKMAANPEAVVTIQLLYDKYSPTKKQQFVSKLKGNVRSKESILTDMSLDDSKEFQMALSKIKLSNLRVCRLGRGLRHGVRSYRSYLPLPLSERVSVYVYPKCPQLRW